MKQYNVAIVGATGLVGSTMVQILEERKFPIDRLFFFASKKSVGQPITFAGEEYVIEELTETSFDRDIDLALFAAGGAISERYAPIAVKKGVKVIDNSSFFRMDSTVPLIVPEVNPEALRTHKGLVANPNCTTIQAVVALKPLEDQFGIKRVVYSTYQAVSGSGVDGLKDLEEGKAQLYPHPIQYNVLPHIDSFLENGYTKEEMKMMEETKKILNNDRMKLTATCVRVPVRYGHSLSINVELAQPFTMEAVYEAFEQAEGITLQDKGSENVYPLALEVQGKDDVYIGRIRRDFSVENGLNLWVVADNIRKGAALNTIQIAEKMIQMLEEEPSL